MRIRTILNQIAQISSSLGPSEPNLSSETALARLLFLYFLIFSAELAQVVHSTQRSELEPDPGPEFSNLVAQGSPLSLLDLTQHNLTL